MKPDPQLQPGLEERKAAELEEVVVITDCHRPGRWFAWHPEKHACYARISYLNPRNWQFLYHEPGMERPPERHQ